MRSIHSKQQGASAIGIIIVLAIIGIGVFLGMQYIPQYMESGKIDSVLASVSEAAAKSPVKNAKEVRMMIDKRLQINNMKDMKELFEITEKGGNVIVTVAYERDLNLLYEQRKMPYEKELVLKTQE